MPVAVRAHAAAQPVDQAARACPLVAVDHDAGRVGERGADSVFGADTLETPVALAEYDALHAPPSRHEFEPITEIWRVVGLSLLVEQMNRRKIALAAFGGRQSAEAADGDRAHDEPGMRQRRGDEIEPGAV